MRKMHDDVALSSKVGWGYGALQIRVSKRNHRASKLATHRRLLLLKDAERSVELKVGDRRALQRPLSL